MNNLERALEEQKRQNQQQVAQISGLLGIPLGGQRRVEVPNRNAYVFVRLRSNQSEVIQAYNNQVATSYNLPVLVERHGNKYIVVGVDTGRYENNWNSQSPFLPRHGNSHSFDLESGGGGDVVWVQSRQMIPSLVFPSGSAGGDSVIVHPYTLRNDDGTWRYVGNTGTARLSPYLPTGSNAVMALVYLNTSNGNPEFIINSGSYFSNTITGSNEVVSYIPPLTNMGRNIPLAAIRLITGTNQISWDNIYDLRQWLHTIPTGSAGGGGSSVGVQGIPVQDEGVFVATGSVLNFVGDPVSVTVSGSVVRVFITGSASGGGINTGTLDARYLKLSADNDPVVGHLLVSGSVSVTTTETGYAALYAFGRNNGRLIELEAQYTDGLVSSPALNFIRHPETGSVPRVISPFVRLYEETGNGVAAGKVLTYLIDDIERISLHPLATGTLPNYFFDVNNTRPTGTVHTSWRVNGVERAMLDVSGTIHSNGVPLVKEAPVDGSFYVRDSAGWEKMHNGQSVLASTVTLTGTTAVFQEITGISLSLPAAGTYLIFGTIRGAINSAAVARIEAKLYNATDAADVVDSEILVIFQATTSTTAQNTVALVSRIEVNAPKVIKLYAARVFTSSPSISEISSNSAGMTRMAYLRVG